MTTDVEIVVFNDKSWVRLIEYQKLKDRYEALEETKEYQNDAICMLQKQIEKMKTVKTVINSAKNLIVFQVCVLGVKTKVNGS